jgi:hypothetical protein
MIPRLLSPMPEAARAVSAAVGAVILSATSPWPTCARRAPRHGVESRP